MTTKVDVRSFATLSEETRTSLTQDVIVINQCADIATMAHENLHGMFKNPNINMHLKRIKDSSEAIKDIMRRDPRYGLKTKDTDYRINIGTELYVFLNLIMHFGETGLSAINENLRLNREYKEELALSYEIINKLAADPMYLSDALSHLATTLLQRAGGKIVPYNDLIKDFLKQFNIQMEDNQNE